MIERALIRADIPVKFSQGFNPRPRLSLPLPRSVGTACERDLACVGLDAAEPDERLIAEDLARELPAGADLLEIEIREGRISPHASAATYVIPAGKLMEDREFVDAVALLEAKLRKGEPVVVIRRSKKGRTVQKDVSQFIARIENRGGEICIETLITDAGSVRVDELLTLLGVDMTRLAGPITRTNVVWDI
ncbi:radical SAM-linked protein [Anaerohalosphaera lusitana]|uniref:Radical SAM-linked protein n=2 Tax=Anaerohalosphaera lusitana TaxID=1936003 RepID=A0A1U9NMQ5_9BACT|nr:radical SAM-linked protein [Anaerohalosphaera lusitana]